MSTNKTTLALFVFCALLLLSFTAFAGRFSDNNLVVQMKGRGGFEFPSARIANLLPPGASGCFVTELVNPKSGWTIGKGYDCLLGEPQPQGEGGGFTIQTAYVLDFNRQGALVTVNNITVQPALDAPAQVTGISHLVGDFPTEHTIYSGSRRFKKAEGSVRVSGGNDLRELDLSDPMSSFITFDYLFVVSFD